MPNGTHGNVGHAALCPTYLAEYYLNPWVQRGCSVQDIDLDSVMKIRSHTPKSGENFHIARRIKSLCDAPR